MNKNNFCSVPKKKKLLSMLSIAYFSLLTIFCKIGYMFFSFQVLIFFLGRIANFCIVTHLCPSKIGQHANVRTVKWPMIFARQADSQRGRFFVSGGTANACGGQTGWWAVQAVHPPIAKHSPWCIHISPIPNPPSLSW
jgi:hypothetical protein